MPEVAMWSLIVALVILCLGITLKAVEYRSLFNKADKEASDLRAEIAMLKKNNEEAIACMAKINDDWNPNIL